MVPKLSKKSKNFNFVQFFTYVFEKIGLTIITLFFDDRYFSSWPIPRKNERNSEKQWLGGKN